MPKVLLHEMAAQKYATFLAESKSQQQQQQQLSHSQPRPGASGHGNLNLPPLSYYRRPRRKRQASDVTAVLRASMRACGFRNTRPPRQRPVFCKERGRERVGERQGLKTRVSASIFRLLQEQYPRVCYVAAPGVLEYF